MSLTEQVMELARAKGAMAVGVSTLETLAGGPPSTDLTYILPEARSAVTFALPLKREAIRAFLSKQNQTGHEQDNIETNIRAFYLAVELCKFLQAKGYVGKAVQPNLVYRKDVPDWPVLLPPDLSHRYLAVRSGVGCFGWSGNVGTRSHGAAIILGTLVTNAELKPTEPLPAEESWCDRCKLCVAGCTPGMIEKQKERAVTIGGKTFTHAERKSYLRCEFVCGGMTGLHRSGQWSTWSPGRYRLPEDEKELFKELARAAENYRKWPSFGTSGYQSPLLQGAKLHMTCGNCQIICWANKEDRQTNHRLLTTSGCVLQQRDGRLVVLPAEAAEKAFAEMEPEPRGLYC